MNVITGKNKDSVVFDNYWVKPPPNGNLSDYSMLVLFRSGGVWYVGQYCYSGQHWFTGKKCITDKNKKEIILDRYVELWAHLPMDDEGVGDGDRQNTRSIPFDENGVFSK
jgi:hypothetical protein